MTREEAIEILQGAIKKPNTKDGYLGQAIDMAIKALSAEPCEDTISRQAVLENAKYFMDAFFNEDGKMMYSDHILCEADCKNLMEWIKSFPPVQPVRPKGKWLFQEITNAYYVTGQCSRCTQRNRIDNFCPNCGADMRGENNG